MQLIKIHHSAVWQFFKIDDLYHLISIENISDDKKQ
jgi:hypothetical protein